MKEYKLIFSIYLSFLFFFVIFFLSAVHNSPVNNSMHEWVINYQGGFTRRGFLGEIIFQLSQLFNFQLKKVFLILQIFLYAGYFYTIYILFKNIKYNYFFAIAIFSPLFFIFSLAELEALGRKDILMFLIFIINFIIYFKFKNINYNYIYFFITFPIIFLTHEIYIIYSVYFLAFFLILEKNLNLIFFLKFLIILFYLFFFIELITSNEFTKDNLKLLCENLQNKSNVKCGLAPYSMIIDINIYQRELDWLKPHREGDWKYSYIIRYVLIFIFGFLGLFVLIIFSKINNEKTNKLISKISLKLIFLLLGLPSILPFITAVDSGRYMSMAYTFPSIFYFGLLRARIILFDYKAINLIIENSFLKIKKYKIILLIVLCFSWSPKAVYHEDISSFPLYRLITKTSDFIGNFENFSNY